MKLSIKLLSIILLIILAPFLFISCSSETQNNNSKKVTSEASVAKMVTLNGTKTVDLHASKIYWKGYKILGHHTGTINLAEGQLNFNNGIITNGKFVVDMNSVKVTELMDEGDDDDEEEEEDESPEDDKSDLANHLMDGDFFDSKTHPTASFVITKANHTGNNYHVTGNMTIKNVTKQVSFQAQLNENTFDAIIPVDRTQFGVKYGSGSFFDNLGDNVIKDKFDLVVSLKLQ